jgi:HEAT repeat protein
MEAALALGVLMRHCHDRQSLAAAALPGLLRTLEDRDEAAREWAARSLGWFGEFGVVAIPALKRALSDPSQRVVQAAAALIEALARKQ